MDESHPDYGLLEATQHMNQYGGELYKSASGWGVKNTVVPGSSKRGSIVPILRFGPIGGSGPAVPVTTFYNQPAANAPGYWDRVGADFAKLPTKLVEHVVVDPAKALVGGAGDIVKGAAGAATDAAKEGIWDLAKGLALPLGLAVTAAVVVMFASSRSGTTAAAVDAYRGR